jgi:hypothetical protein
MNVELAGMEKEAVVTYIKEVSQYSAGLRKTTKSLRIRGVQTGILNRVPPGHKSAAVCYFSRVCISRGYGAGREFDSRWVIGFFSWPNPSSHTMALGWTQPLTEMSTRNLPEGEAGA